MTPRDLLRHRVTFAVATPLAAFVVYLITLSRSVGFIDAGELTTAAWTLGVAHPTGYPLFILIGWVFSHLPIAHDVVVRMNIMAAFWCSAGLVFYFLFFDSILEMLRHKAGVRDIRASGGGHVTSRLIAASAVLFLAFSETYWSQAVAVEVYSLHLFFVGLLLYLFVPSCLGTGTPRWFLFAFVLGLSFANHMTTILLAPGFLFLYFGTQGWGRTAWRRIGMMTPPFLLGLTPYLLIPLRASMSPAMNWGNATTIERFLWHASGKQYRVWIFSSTEAAGKQFAYFASSLPAEFAYVGIPLALIGVVALWRAHRVLAVSTILLFVGCIAYSINYDIHDIDSYFLLAYICIAFWSAVGMNSLARLIIGSAPWQRAAAAFLIGCVGVSTLVMHYARNDESKDFLVEDYTHDMLSSLGTNALVFSYQWDYWVSASFYYQLVCGERPDVMVIDKELLRRSWYIQSLRSRYPVMMAKSMSEVDQFLTEVDRFEHDLPYNPRRIEGAYIAMIESFISRNIGERPVYVTGEIEPAYTRGYQRVPQGLAFRLYADHDMHPVAVMHFTPRPAPRRGRLEDLVGKLYSDAFLAASVYNRNSPK